MALLLGLFLAASVFPKESTKNCRQQVTSFVFARDSQARESRIQKLRSHFESRLYEADAIDTFNKALQIMIDRGDRIPQIRNSFVTGSSQQTSILRAENLVIGEGWMLQIPLKEIFARIGPQDITANFQTLRNGRGNDSIRIQKAEVKNRPLILRTPMGPSIYGAIRKTAAAAKLNEAMILSTTPRARWIFFESTLILASALLKGYLPSPFNPTHYDAWSLADMEGFEFLVGQTDGNENNMRVEEDSGIRIFDHDLAFLTGIPEKNELLYAGSSLPKNYTLRFIRELRRLKRDYLIDRFSHLLTLDEIDFIMLRREILLVDFEKNKDTKIIYGP